MSRADQFAPRPAGSPAERPVEPLAAWSGVPQGPSPGVRTTLDQMAVRMDTVVEAAERAAQVIRYDAEEQARRHLADAHREADRLTAERVRLIAELTDELIAHAGEVRRRSEQMIAALERAIASVDATERRSEQAVAYARSLAVAGYDRDAIAGALHRYFGILDADPVLQRALRTPG